MPTPETSIWLALKGRVDSLSLSPALTVHFPNDHQFDPPQDAGPPVRALNYLSVAHLPNTTETASVGRLGSNRHTGILQITLHARKDQDIAVSKEICGLIVEHFKFGGLPMTSGGVTVRVERPPSVRSDVSRSNEALMRVPISVRYYADVQRT